MKVREEKLRTIIEWSEKNEDVRVLLLTSSLVNPLALVDEFSDLDIEFVFEDNTNYISDKSWTLKFGNPIAMIEEDESCFNHKHAMKMLLYEDGVKVDFKLYRSRTRTSTGTRSRTIWASIPSLRRRSPPLTTRRCRTSPSARWSRARS